MKLEFDLTAPIIKWILFGATIEQMRKELYMKVGDRVKFVGLFARPWETEGEIVQLDRQYVRVRWGDRIGFLHSSQVEVIDA